MAAKPEPVVVVVKEVRQIIVGGKYIFREERTVSAGSKVTTFRA